MPANTSIRSIVEAPARNQTLVTAGVESANSLMGTSSWIGKAGALLPTSTLSAWLASGSGVVVSGGVMISEGVVISESGKPNPINADDTRLPGEP